MIYDWLIEQKIEPGTKHLLKILPCFDGVLIARFFAAAHAAGLAAA
jgi:hypothetical protein